MKILLTLVLASLALNACGSGPEVCHGGCLCYRTPESCPGPAAGCYPSYTESVDGSAPQFFCSNGPADDAGTPAD